MEITPGNVVPGTALPIDFVVGQFNADPDGKLDVAIAGQSSSNILLLYDFDPSTVDESNDGFANRRSISVGSNPISLVAGDFDNNQTLDLAVVHLGTQELVSSSPPRFGKVDETETIQVLLNAGDGTFASPAGGIVQVPGDDPVVIVTGQFTPDANLDIAVLHASPTLPGTPFGDVALFAGNGAGGFSLLGGQTEVGGSPHEMVAGDFNSDGISDLAVANAGTNSLTILTGTAAGTLQVESAVIGTGEKGVDRLDVGDLDNDGDLDIVGTRLNDAGVAIFRNITDTTASDVTVAFEPLDSVGLAQFSVFDRAPLVLANLDGDTLGPNGEGTIDVLAIPKSTAQINVLLNRLVDGGHRVALDGTNQITDLNFIVKPAVIPPTLDAVPGLVVLDEDETYTVNLSGISIGRQDSADFRITVFSSHPEIIPDQVVRLAPGQSEASFVLSPLLNANTGMTPNETPITITVEARNAGPGAVAVFGDGDDGVTTRTFTVIVNPVNDPPTFSLPAELPPVSQKALPQSVADFVSEITAGGGDDENGQALYPFVISTDTSFFDAPPAIDSAGRLTFTPSDRRSGPVSVTVSLSDTGGTENGGSDTTIKTFVINILPVNDPPTFNLSESQVSVRADAGSVMRPGFAYGFDSGGGPDEDSQSISDYLVLTQTPGLFQVLPQIDGDGLLTFTPAADRSGTTDVTVRVRDSGGTDNLGTDLSGPITFQITIEPVPDTTPPRPLLTSSAPAITNQQSFDVLVSFGEPVVSFSASDVTVVRGSVRTPIDLGGGNYVVPIDADPGTVQVSIGAGAVDDLSGNPNLASPTLTRTVNTTALVPRLSSTSSRMTNADTILVNVDFAREVFGFDLADIVVEGATIGNLVAVDTSSGQYEFELSIDIDGDVTVSIPAGAASDVAGNLSVASNLLERTVERTAPHPVLSFDVSSPTDQASFFVDIDFGEPVEGFELDDLTVTNATVSQLRSVAPGRYSVLLSAVDGSVTIGIDAAVTRDLAGNDNSAATTVSVIVDTIGVTPTLTSNSPDLSSLNAIPISIDFGEQVIGFEISDLLVDNGAVTELSLIDAITGTYEATISPSTDGLVSVNIAGGAATDVAGNPTGASGQLSRTIDRVSPQPTLRVRGAS
ncbi:MAG: VCBS repeat-containing protein, partial [Planctomycetales bacterium]|nr:VCBS repeat-containing protein [Planctomycetales bacterium]